MAILRPPKFPLRNMAEMAKWLQEQQIEAGLGVAEGDNRVLVTDADGERSWERRFEQWPGQWRGSSNQSLGTTAVTIDLDTEDVNPNSNIYANANDTVQVQVSGYYRIGYTVYASVDTTGGSANCNVLAFLRRNGSAIGGSYSAAYLNETSLPDASCDGHVIASLGEGDTIDIQAQLSAAMDVSTVANRCKITFERIR